MLENPRAQCPTLVTNQYRKNTIQEERWERRRRSRGQCQYTTTNHQWTGQQTRGKMFRPRQTYGSSTTKLELPSLLVIAKPITNVLVQIVVSNPNSIADVSFRNIISNVFVPIAVLTLCLTSSTLIFQSGAVVNINSNSAPAQLHFLIYSKLNCISPHGVTAKDCEISLLLYKKGQNSA